MLTISDLTNYDISLKNKKNNLSKKLKSESFILLIKPSKNTFTNAKSKDLIEKNKIEQNTDAPSLDQKEILIKISRENFFWARKTPKVKWNKIITEAIADATPKPDVPYANRHIGTPIFPVLGKKRLVILLYNPSS